MRRPEPRRHTKPTNQELIIGQIADERRRQIEEEGWTAEHDDAEHPSGELAKAAAAYAGIAGAYGRVRSDVSIAGYQACEPPPQWWPWSRKWWKPKNPRRDLIRAAALIVAEIERLDRSETA